MYRMMNENREAILAELDRISDLPRYLELRRRLYEKDIVTDESFHGGRGTGGRGGRRNEGTEGDQSVITPRRAFPVAGTRARRC